MAGQTMEGKGPAPASAARWAEPLGLFALALAVRSILAATFPDPGYPDGAYYVEVARSVGAGRGFNVDFLWTFIEVGGRIPADPHLPVPSNAHWAPLASMVQVPFIWLLGPSIGASLIPFVLIGALAAPLAWAIARDAGASRMVRLGAGFLGAVPAAATVFTAQPNNVALTMVFGGGALWLTARGLNAHPRSFAMAGLLVGLATLARTDGLLLAAAPLAAFAWDRWRPASRIPWTAALGCAGLFLLVVAPWYLRQVAVFGSPTPSTAAGVLWLRSFADLNSVTADRTLGSVLAQGLASLVASRALALWQALAVFGGLVCGVVLAPFVIAGAWRRRRSPDFGPAFAFAGVLLAVSVVLFAIHVPNGMFLHASVALAPHAYVLAVEAIAVAGAVLAGRRARWHRERMTGVLVAAGCVLVAGVAVLTTLDARTTWDTRRQRHEAIAEGLDAAGATMDDRIMSTDAAGYRYVSGRGGVVSPDDPLPVIEEAARAYDIRWIIVERDGAVRSLAPLLDGAERPAWIGAPVFIIPGTDEGALDAALYPVCVDPGDQRCEAGP
jgi:hypothetical protein